MDYSVVDVHQEGQQTAGQVSQIWMCQFDWISSFEFLWITVLSLTGLESNYTYMYRAGQMVMLAVNIYVI